MERTRTSLLSALVVGFALVGGGMAEAKHTWAKHRWATKDGVVDVYADVSDVEGDWTAATAEVLEDWDRSEQIELDRDPAGKQGVLTVSSGTYGPTGWLGVAMIKFDPNQRIAAGRVELNEWYWTIGLVDGQPGRHQVYCQEVGHIFGLGHQSDDSCMNDELSLLGGWRHPNDHDYEQLATIYSVPDGYDSGTSPSTSSSYSARSCDQQCARSHHWVVVHVFEAPDHRAHG